MKSFKLVDRQAGHEIPQFHFSLPRAKLKGFYFILHLLLLQVLSPINFSLFDHLSGVKRLVELVVAATVGPVAPLPVFDGPPDVEPEPLIRR